MNKKQKTMKTTRYSKLENRSKEIVQNQPRKILERRKRNEKKF